MTEGWSGKGLRKLHETMTGFVQRGEVPGLVALVSNHGETHVDVAGSKSVGGAPLERDSIFRISSMTKPITGAATMVLVDDGKLQLDARVDTWLPELAKRRVLKRLEGPLEDTVSANRPITVRDLLTFRLGFGLVFGPPGTYPIADAMNDLHLAQGPPQPSVAPDPDEWIRRLGTLPLMHQPGEKWMYNTGADVLGVLVARASGVPFEEFLRKRIFEPLEMKDTGFSVPASKLERLTVSYWNDFRTGAFEVYDPVDGQWSRKPAFPSGGGGLVSTADDYHAFAQMMLNRGKYDGKRILSAEAVEAMTTDQLTPEQKSVSGLVPGFFDTYGWGFCTAVVTKPVGVPFSTGTYGWDGGMGTIWRSDPQKGLITILMTSRLWSSPVPPKVCQDFWASAYAALND